MSEVDRTQALRELIFQTNQLLEISEKADDGRRINIIRMDELGRSTISKLLSIAENYLELREALDFCATQDVDFAIDTTKHLELRKVAAKTLSSSDSLLETL